MHSPPTPVAEGSPTWARKSLETERKDRIRFNPRDPGAAIRTIKEGVEIVVVNFAEFEKIFACFWASIYLEINDNVAQRCLEQDRHDQGPSVRWRKKTSATLITRDEARRCANGCSDLHLNHLFTSALGPGGRHDGHALLPALVQPSRSLLFGCPQRTSPPYATRLWRGRVLRRLHTNSFWGHRIWLGRQDHEREGVIAETTRTVDG